MKTMILTALMTAAGLVSRAAAASDGEMTVMAYNLRYASAEPPNAWQQRRPVAAEMLDQVKPDLIGTQEGVYEQIKDLSADLPAYDWIGTGRDGGSRGELMAVFYRKDRFVPLEFNHFWLSDTPNVIASSTWGNTCRRMVTWVRFLDRRTKQAFYFANTHFDHAVARARRKSATLVLERIRKLDPNYPVILAGDFNAVAGSSKPHEILTGKDALVDTWTVAKQRSPLVSTFHGYAGPRKDGSRIDWILARGRVTVLSAKIITFRKDGQYPSDHFPIIARLKISTK